MHNLHTLPRLLIAMAIAGSLTACGSYNVLKPDQKTDYKHSRTEGTLEVPPDLTVSTIDDTMVVPDINPESTATYSAYSSERGGSGVATASRGENVLVTPENIRIAQDGDKRWLVIDAAPSAVWGKMREFWLQNGFLIKREDPRIGILETDWAENRADIPQDPIRKVIGKAFDNAYSAPTRDMYRVRLERGEEGGTELYIAHRGVLEVVKGGDSTVWQERPSNPELEAEMLSRLMLFFGVEEGKAQRMLASADSAPVRATMIQGADGAALELSEDFSRAWRRTGVALDRVGFSVEDRDRSKGVYFVRYDDPLADQKDKGLLSKMKFWGSDDEKSGNVYQIKLSGEGASTRITVQNSEGAPERSSTATRILTLLHEQLK